MVGGRRGRREEKRGWGWARREGGDEQEEGMRKMRGWRWRSKAKRYKGQVTGV
jgi:hypothetical protein